MSALKPIFREAFQAVVHAAQQLKEKLPHFTDAIVDHVDTVRRRVDDIDRPDDLPTLTGKTTSRIDRTSAEPLYRSDNRPPTEIFDEGFRVRDATNNDLEHFVRTNAPANFVSTTRDPDLYQRWPADYRYTVDAPGGLDVDAMMPHGPYAPGTAAPESEIAFQGGIDPGKIVGAHPVVPGGALGKWIPNPNYSGGR